MIGNALGKTEKGCNIISTRAKRWLAVLLSALFTLIPFLMDKVSFMEDDDYLLSFIANGSYGSDMNSWLVFTKAFFGYLLKPFYFLNDRMNWYAAAMGVILFLSMTGIFFCLLEGKRSFWCFLITAGIFATVEPFFFTFTMVAFMGSAAGILLIYTGLINSVRLSYVIPGILLAFLSWGIRSSAFLPTVLLSLPLFIRPFLNLVSGLVKNKEQKHDLRRGFFKGLTAICLTAVLFGGANALEKAEYAPPEWTQFMNYMNARSTVVDFPAADYAAHSEEFAEAGLSGTDYAMAVSWRFVEKDVFTEEALTKAGEIQSRAAGLPQRIAYTKNVFKDRTNQMILLLPTLIFLFLLFAEGGARWKTRALLLFFFYGINGALCVIPMRYVPRVAVALAFADVFFLLIPSGQKEEGKKNKRSKETAVLTTAAALVFFLLAAGDGALYLKNFWQGASFRRHKEHYQEREAVRELVRNSKDTLYVFDSLTLAENYYYGLPALKAGRTEDLSNVVRSGSWDSFSPRYYRQVSHFDVDPDNLFSSMVDNDHVVFVTHWPDTLNAFLQERTGREIEVKAENLTDDTYICSYTQKE